MADSPGPGLISLSLSFTLSLLKKKTFSLGIIIGGIINHYMALVFVWHYTSHGFSYYFIIITHIIIIISRAL